MNNVIMNVINCTRCLKYEGCLWATQYQDQGCNKIELDFKVFYAPFKESGRSDGKEK